MSHTSCTTSQNAVKIGEMYVVQVSFQAVARSSHICFTRSSAGIIHVLIESVSILASALRIAVPDVITVLTTSPTTGARSRLNPFTNPGTKSKTK